jgi:hypothetical protein
MFTEAERGAQIAVTECRNVACELAHVVDSLVTLKAEGRPWRSMAVLYRR